MRKIKIKIINENKQSEQNIIDQMFGGLEKGPRAKLAVKKGKELYNKFWNASKISGIDIKVLLSMGWQESRFGVDRRRSEAGATDIMQMTPTARRDIYERASGIFTDKGRMKKLSKEYCATRNNIICKRRTHYDQHLTEEEVKQVLGGNESVETHILAAALFLSFQTKLQNKSIQKALEFYSGGYTGSTKSKQYAKEVLMRIPGSGLGDYPNN